MKIDVRLSKQQIKQMASCIDRKDVQEYINNNKLEYERFLQQQDEDKNNIDTSCDNAEWIQQGNKLICKVKLNAKGSDRNGKSKNN